MAAKFTYYGGQIIYAIYKNILWCNKMRKNWLSFQFGEAGIKLVKYFGWN